MPNRNFLPQDLVIKSKTDVLPFYQSLLDRIITSADEFAIFLDNISELDSAISENMAWRYIKMTCDTTNKELESDYLFFVQEIQPHIAPFEDLLNRKIIESPFCKEFESQNSYYNYFRSLRGAVEIYREENIEIQAELQSLAQEYSSIQGAMMVNIDGKEFTMQQASNLLLETDRTTREKAWMAMLERRHQDTEALQVIFDKMIAKRHQLAINAGFENYRDYMFRALGRYDYTVQDCLNFHNAIEHEVVPILRSTTAKRKQQLGLDALKPWDMAVDPLGRKPLKPFNSGTELLEKSIYCLNNLDSFFSECLSDMKERNLLDLDSRKGKAPGGYNYPLAESNVPFIFMNASGNLRDVETLVHEAGHAIHSYLMAPLQLNAFKNTPSEVAELASMSMELLTMDFWNVFFNSDEELKRAKLEQLEGIISTLPWIATVDAFQHWIYENPNHSRSERSEKWIELNKRFGTGMVDFTGLEYALEFSWHKQLHIFEVPFYYIEYGFAQLGALGLWKNYCSNSKTAIDQYKAALTKGYTESIPDIYATAGVRFDFSADYVKRLFTFVEEKIKSFE